MRARWIFYLVVLTLSLKLICSRTTRPNIVILLADDLGYGDVGCFGNTTIRTPELDRMAKEGAKLTQHFAGASLCTPSRAALLTGRYAVRSGMAAPADTFTRVMPYLACSGGLPDNETTFAKLAKSAGYKTALIGKWHLGFNKKEYGDNVHSPMNHGFDYFYGIPWTNVKDFGNEGIEAFGSAFPHWRLQVLSVLTIIWSCAFFLAKHGLIQRKIIGFSVASLLSVPSLFVYFFIGNFVIANSILSRNGEVIEQPMILQNLTRRFVREGIEFINDRKNDGLPFLLMMSWSHVHTHIATNPQFTGKSAHGRYGDAIEELDWGVGEILKALDDRGLGKNTFAYFTSDNGGYLEEDGAHGEQDGGWNGIYKGGKMHGAPEGGIRVPTIVRYPNLIPQNTVTNEPTIFMDILPTIANMIGVDIPRDRIIDGKDMMPLLIKDETKSRHKFMFHYCGDAIHAVRYRPDTGTSVWKLVYFKPRYMEGTTECLFQCNCYDAINLDIPELHDITSDPSEKYPIDYSKDKQLKAIVDKMMIGTEKHKKTVIQVPNQYSKARLQWNPRLQPCCGGVFPFCSCVEEERTV